MWLYPVRQRVIFSAAAGGCGESGGLPKARSPGCLPTAFLASCPCWVWSASWFYPRIRAREAWQGGFQPRYSRESSTLCEDITRACQAGGPSDLPILSIACDKWSPHSIPRAPDHLGNRGVSEA